MYKCMICGKEHDSIEGYAACVASCNRKAQEEQKKLREEKLMREKSERFKSISTKYNDLQKELREFARDYGYTPITFSGSIVDLFNSLF